MSAKKTMALKRLLAVVVLLAGSSVLAASRKSYVVYLGAHSPALRAGDQEDDSSMSAAAVESHHTTLAAALGDPAKARGAIFYSYTKHINGFAAVLAPAEAEALKSHPDVLSVFPGRGLHLHTTRTWQFAGLENADGSIPNNSLWTKARFGEGTVVANLDSGVTPQSKSFSDDGFGAIPAKWRGSCEPGADKNFSCNKKLIGARFFNAAYAAAAGTPLNASFNSPRDVEGHGTHTLATAGGTAVAGASVFNLGKGTARGGAPRSRVAAYRVCYPPLGDAECFDPDILAGFDAAISDKVDVISVSLGGDTHPMYLEDGIAIGSLHAVRTGAVVVCSAGNDGIENVPVSNVAPWVITVAASTVDRVLSSSLQFNGITIEGQSMSSSSLPAGKSFPMISGLAAKSSNATDDDANMCVAGSLAPEKAKGKIVVCARGNNARVEKGLVVKLAGGAGMVLANDVKNGNDVIADAHVLPAVHISYNDGITVSNYLSAAKSPTGYITPAKTVLGKKPSPTMAGFSSRGPNPLTPAILKPDITAPGVNIIAAWSPLTSPTDLPFDHRVVPFNVVSGTSMACPHVAGIAGLLKTLHPDWSPAAIKSAIMTSARTRDNAAEAILDSVSVEATALNYGSGHVRPNRAMDPGLVYDNTFDDYLQFLCAAGYNTSVVGKLEPGFRCPPKPIRMEDFNYPAIFAAVDEKRSPLNFSRKVKLVGDAPATYTARVVAPGGIPQTKVAVTPPKLEFKSAGEELSFTVTVAAGDEEDDDDEPHFAFGRMVWSDGKHFVRSPIVVNFNSYLHQN